MLYCGPTLDYDRNMLKVSNLYPKLAWIDKRFTFALVNDIETLFIYFYFGGSMMDFAVDKKVVDDFQVRRVTIDFIMKFLLFLLDNFRTFYFLILFAKYVSRLSRVNGDFEWEKSERDSN